MSEKIKVGDRVHTPLGVGVVVSQMMAPPTYSRAEAYSVRLDCKIEDPKYTGSTFPADFVGKIPTS